MYPVLICSVYSRDLISFMYFMQRGLLIFRLPKARIVQDTLSFTVCPHVGTMCAVVRSDRFITSNYYLPSPDWAWTTWTDYFDGGDAVKMQ